MARIYIESLSKEYRDKLKNRELSKASIESLFYSISEKYYLRRTKSLYLVIILCVLALFMNISTLLMTKQEINLPFIFFVVLLPSIAISGIVFFVYHIAVLRVPKQFAKCLEIGYPELVMQYGYEAIKNAKKTSKPSNQPRFVLSVQDTFHLKDCNDLVVVGFAQGIISYGTEVFLSETMDRTAEQHKVRITAIETGPGKSVKEASDCHVALRVAKGNFYNIKEGSVLYR